MKEVKSVSRPSSVARRCIFLGRLRMYAAWLGLGLGLGLGSGLGLGLGLGSGLGLGLGLG